MSEALAEGVAAGDAADAVVEDAPVVEVPAAPAYDPTDDPRVLDLVRSQAAQIADERVQQLIAEAQRGNQQQQAGPTPDGLTDEYGNINPAALAEFLAARDAQMFGQIDQRLQQITGPLEARQQAETVAEGEQRIADMVADDISRNGDFPSDPETGKSAAKELIRPLADAFFNDVAAVYGATPRAAEIAVGKAAATVRALVSEAKQAAITEQVNRNAKLAGAQGEPGAGAGSGVVTLPDKPLTPRELALKYGARADGLRNTA